MRRKISKVMLGAGFLLIVLILFAAMSLLIGGGVFLLSPVFKFLLSNKLIMAVFWLFMPGVAYCFGAKNIRRRFSIRQLMIIRLLLMVAVVFVSVFVISNYYSFQDVIGKQFVDGYHRYFAGEDVDENGTQLIYNTVTDHWYSRFALWVFECAVIILCVLFPVLTYLGITRGINKLDEQRITTALEENTKIAIEEGSRVEIWRKGRWQSGTITCIDDVGAFVLFGKGQKIFLDDIEPFNIRSKV